MVEKRDRTSSFATKQSEKDRIEKASKFLGVRVSDFMRDPVMDKLEKVEKQMAKQDEKAL